MAEKDPAAKVTFVNQNGKSFKVNLFGPKTVAIVLAAFEASQAVLEDDSVMEANDDGLSMDTFAAGVTYNLIVRPVVPQDGEPREEGNTSIENIHSKLDSISALLQGLLSRTRAASTINVDDLRVLRRCLDIAPLPEEEDVSLISLLGAETEGGESFWDGDTYELQRKDEYKRQFKEMTSSRDVLWNDANRMTIKMRFSNLEFPVAANNHLVLSLRHFGSSLMSSGAILGVEIKRKLSWRGLREAEVEFYV